MPSLPSMPRSLCESRFSPSMLFFSSSARWMSPLPSSVTRLPGCGRSSPHSQKSTAWWASTSNGMSGEASPAQRGASPLIWSESDLPSIWMPPSGNSQSSAPRYQSFSARVFWNCVSFGSLETAISARLLCRM